MQSRLYRFNEERFAVLSAMPSDGSVIELEELMSRTGYDKERVLRILCELQKLESIPLWVSTALPENLREIINKQE